MPPLRARLRPGGGVTAVGGRKPVAQAYDAFIAAAAIAENVPLYRCNPDGCTEIGALDVRALAIPITHRTTGRSPPKRLNFVTR